MLERLAPRNADLIADAVAGLAASPKHISPKWFYDARGSALFEDITRLPEYYPTRVETEILRQRAAEIAALVGPGTALTELGSGASVKTRLLLDEFRAGATYAPLDISREFLAETVRALHADYPSLDIVPVTADFMQPVDLPLSLDAMPKLLFFPGSTIGNFVRWEAEALLARLRRWHGVTGLVLGTDLVKDRDVLTRAYDDAAGVTAAFNKNLLVRLNREAHADFDFDGFDHEARWNEDFQRIEMHLVSRRAQSVAIDGQSFSFAAGERLHTENSHKFTPESLAALAKAAGWSIEQIWTDDGENFAVSVLTPA